MHKLLFYPVELSSCSPTCGVARIYIYCTAYVAKQAAASASCCPNAPQTAANTLVTNCKSQRLVWCRIRAQQSAVDASMPEWVFTDLQQRLNAAQQLLTQQSMTYEQGHLAGTWPRSRPRSPARRGMQQLLLQHCV